MPTINKKSHYNKIKAIDHAKNNTSSPYYSSMQWKNLRNYYIRRHPLCEECLKNDRVTSAQEVHHIKEFMSGTTEQQRWNLLLNEDNLMSVCRECHMNIHFPQRVSKNC